MRAKRRSRRTKFVSWGGSTRLITSWMMERACEAAYWRALNQVVKRSLIAVGLEVSKSFNRNCGEQAPYIVFIVYAT